MIGIHVPVYWIHAIGVLLKMIAIRTFELSSIKFPRARKTIVVDYRYPYEHHGLLVSEGNIIMYKCSLTLSFFKRHIIT